MEVNIGSVLRFSVLDLLPIMPVRSTKCATFYTHTVQANSPALCPFHDSTSPGVPSSLQESQELGRGKQNLLTGGMATDRHCQLMSVLQALVACLRCFWADATGFLSTESSVRLGRHLLKGGWKNTPCKWKWNLFKLSCTVGIRDSNETVTSFAGQLLYLGGVRCLF